MTGTLVEARRRAIALVAGVALGAGSIAVGVTPASAAAGDIASFDVGPGAQPVDIVRAPDGTMWSANEGANSISRITTDGQITSFPVPGVGPNALTYGPDGAVWFTYSGTAAVGRMDTSGSARNFPTGVAGGTGSDIEVGYDDRLWFTMPDVQIVGRISTSGNVVRYSGVGAAQSITRGPARSGAMYFSAGTNGIASIAPTGARASIPTPGASATGQIQNVGGSIWFGMTNAQGQIKLAKLAGGSVSDVNALQITNINDIASGLGDSVYITDTAAQRIVHVTSAGAVAATFASRSDANASTLGSDGNLWVAAGSGNSQGQIRRILSGVTPEVINPPYTTPAADLASGEKVLANKGDWRYDPSSYAYQWQICDSRSANSCADVPGANASSYIVTGSDVGKYLRVGVSASNANGASAMAYSTFAATDGAAGGTTPGVSKVASIGAEYTMQLRAPKKQKRGQRKWYIVTFSAEDTSGTVTFEFRKGSRTKTKTITIGDDEASYRWRVPRNWRKGSTRVTATFQPSPGETELTSAVVGSRVRIR